MFEERINFKYKIDKLIDYTKLKNQITKDTPNTLTAITNTTTPTPTTNTTTPTATINVITITTTAAQTQIASLMELNVPLPPRLRTPSTSLTIPLSSSSPPTLIFSHTLQELQQSGLWGTLLPGQ